MPTTPQQITSAIINLLSESPQGMHSTEIVHSVQQNFSDVRNGQVIGRIRQLRLDPESNIKRLSRGLYRHIKFQSEEEVREEQEEEIEEGINNEANFYKPFAEYLMEELEECTKAIVLGGNRFGGRWGTPDVIGVNKSYDFEPIKHGVEIISAEIKTDGHGLIIAFGQACAYRLFSHKVYIVIPENAPRDDIDRIESLCLIFGIGLILFNPSDRSTKTFKILTRAIKHEPDFSYVNENIGSIAQELLRD